MATPNLPITKPLFSGNVKAQGLLMEIDTNGLQYGFIVDPASTSIPFGAVVQKGASDNLVKAGVSATATNNYGIAVYSEAISTSRPASSDVYLAGMPINVLLDGYMWFYPENMAGVTRASKVLADNATGAISFGAQATEDVNTALTWAKVVLVDEKKTRVLVKVDVSLA
mgnify:CR=1 FL=1